jgi:hypothetical protein
MVFHDITYIPCNTVLRCMTSRTKPNNLVTRSFNDNRSNKVENTLERVFLISKYFDP